MQAPVMVLNTNAERDSGKRAQFGNIAAAKAVSDIIRTTLGPQSMLKMILDPMGGIVLTNDGNAILREIDVNHPAAKTMIEIAKTQDDEVGDGTTSVIILAGEFLQLSEQFLHRRLHPRTIVTAYNEALIDAEEAMKNIAIDLDINNDGEIMKIIESTINTKFLSKNSKLICELAYKAVKTIRDEDNYIDIKRLARVERIPGGTLEDSCVLDGVMVNKDVLHPQMRRNIKNPRIICLDMPLEYNKGESQTNIEITKEEDFERYLQIEEEYVYKLCSTLLKLKPDIVTTEKGCSELAQHYLAKGGCTVLRRMRKTDNVRLAKATGAIIQHRVDLLTEKDVGKECGLYEVRQIAGEAFSFFIKCKNPKACSIILRGGSKDILQELNRNLEDAMAVTKNILLNPKILPGGGSTEMALSNILIEKSNKINGIKAYPYRAIAKGLEVIPRILINNCGKSPIKVLTKLRAKQNDLNLGNKRFHYGIDGKTGDIVDMNQYNIWEPFVVKMQTIRSAIETTSMLLRIDDVVSGLTNKED